MIVTNQNKPAFKPRPDTGLAIEPYQQDPGLEEALDEYLARFSYRVRLRLGPTWNPKFKEFHEWCAQRLGLKYKDWFLYSLGKDHYMLYVKDSKWATFLALTWVDMLA